jgi:hypothetical protein
VGIAVGIARLAVGGVLFGVPVASVRLLSLDTATATRVTWLSRMTAARDGVLGAGTLSSAVLRQGCGGWMLAGSVSDVADAAILAAPLRAGRVRGPRAVAVTVAAVAVALVGAAATADVIRGDRARSASSPVQRRAAPAVEH